MAPPHVRTSVLSKRVRVVDAHAQRLAAALPGIFATLTSDARHGIAHHHLDCAQAILAQRHGAAGADLVNELNSVCADELDAALPRALYDALANANRNIVRALVSFYTQPHVLVRVQQARANRLVAQHAALRKKRRRVYADLERKRRRLDAEPAYTGSSSDGDNDDDYNNDDDGDDSSSGSNGSDGSDGSSSDAGSSSGSSSD